MNPILGIVLVLALFFIFVVLRAVNGFKRAVSSDEFRKGLERLASSVGPVVPFPPAVDATELRLNRQREAIDRLEGLVRAQRDKLEYITAEMAGVRQVSIAKLRRRCAALEARKFAELPLTQGDVESFARWAVAQMQGDSGAGHSHWEQFPEYRRGVAALAAVKKPEGAAS